MRADPVFPGVSRPSSDFPSVRSELRAPPMYRDVDLSVARSLLNGTASRLSLVGNVIYVDQKANSGYASLHVQDDASIGNTPITAFSGFILRAPFTEIIFENVAQPGQVMRLIYGTDLDFVPAIGAGVNVISPVNTVTLVGVDCGYLTYGSATEPVGNNVRTLLAPASNPRGYLVRSAYIAGNAGAGGSLNAQIFASAVAPGAIGVPQSKAMHLLNLSSVTTTTITARDAPYALQIPQDWGVYLQNQVGVSVANLVGYLSGEAR